MRGFSMSILFHARNTIVHKLGAEKSDALPNLAALVFPLRLITVCGSHPETVGSRADY